MRMFFFVGGSHGGPVQDVLRFIAARTHELVESLDEAELFVTDSIDSAADALRAHKTAVLFALQPARRARDEIAAQLLQSAYPGRVFIRPILENDGEENIVHFLMRKECRE